MNIAFILHPYSMKIGFSVSWGTLKHVAVSFFPLTIMIIFGEVPKGLD